MSDTVGFLIDLWLGRANNPLESKLGATLGIIHLVRTQNIPKN